MSENKIKSADCKVKILKDEGLNFEVKIQIPADIIDSKINSELSNVSTKVKMDGFRAGKVPKSVVEKKYGTSVRQDILQQEINLMINNVVKDNNLVIAADPKIDDFKAEKGRDIEFNVKFERMPKVDMPDFKKISIEKAILQVSEKDLEERLAKLAESSKEFLIESTTKATKGDQVTLDAVGYVDGVAFDGGKLQGHKLVLGSKSFIDTFEDQLIGVKKGDEVTVKVTFPENYHATDLAGKPSEFIVKVIAVHKPHKTEINDEFAKKFNIESVEKLKEQVSEAIKIEYSEPVNTIMKMNLFDQLEKILTFEVPSSLIDREYQILKSQGEELKKSDESLKGKNDEELDTYYHKLALRRVRIGLMLAEYVQVKGIIIDQDDIRQAIAAQTRSFPGQEMAIVEYYQKNPKALEALKGPILEEKGVQYIFNNEINIKEKHYSRNELENYLDQENNRDLV